MSAQKKKILTLGIAVLALAAVMALVWFFSAQQGVQGTKALTVTVIQADGAQEEFKFSTDAEFLRGALEEQHLVEGEESAYGLYVKTVNGVTADEAQQQWWCFTKGGAELTTGVDTTPVADGDCFEITLKTGW